MENLVRKVAIIMIIIVGITCMMPSFVKASEETLEAITLVKTSGEKIVYIKDFEATEFKYAFSNDKNDTNLKYTSCSKDSNNENVALLENDETYTYMFILDESNTKIIELNNLNSITEKEIQENETLTDRISVDTTGRYSYSSTTEDGVSVTTTQGKITIIDDSNYEYQYELIELVDKNNTVQVIDETALDLYESINNIETAKTMYEKLLLQIKIRDDYKTLLKNADWEDVKEQSILQPENSQEGEKFIVLLQKIENQNVIEQDIQIMTCDREDDEDVEYMNEVVSRVVEKRTALPVTGENLIIYIGLGVILIAIVVVAIKMKKLKGKDNE